MKKNYYDDREGRLECLKLAATLVMQNKLKQGDVLPLARTFMAFIIEGDPPSEDRNHDTSATQEHRRNGENLLRRT